MVFRTLSMSLTSVIGHSLGNDTVWIYSYIEYRINTRVKGFVWILTANIRAGRKNKSHISRLLCPFNFSKRGVIERLLVNTRKPPYPGARSLISGACQPSEKRVKTTGSYWNKTQAETVMLEGARSLSSVIRPLNGQLPSISCYRARAR